jgi:glycine cleavage system H protein
VVEVNAALAQSPELINTAPYAGGWICKIAPSDKAELAKLMEPADYQKLIG